MERLTARTNDGYAYLVNVKKNEQEVDSKYPNTLKCILDAFEKLAKYEEAGQRGKLVELPCTVGEKIYYIGFGHVCEYEVQCIDVHNDKLWIVIEICYEDRHGFWSDEFGETIFLSKEEAAKALEKQNVTCD